MHRRSGGSAMDAFVNLLDADRMPHMSKTWRPQLANHLDKLLTPKELKRSVLHGERMQALIEEVRVQASKPDTKSDEAHLY